jgi:hypothetical protein
MQEQCEKITAELRTELLYAGFQISTTNEGYRIYDFHDETLEFSVDISIMNCVDNKVVNRQSCQNNKLNMYMMKSELFPLVERTFGAYTIWCPNDLTKYFERCNMNEYMKCDIITKLCNKENNDLLQKFLEKYQIHNITIRDASIISRIDNFVLTSDWKSIFTRCKELIPQDFNPIAYQQLNGDLKNLDAIGLYVHFIKIGRFEKRYYNVENSLPLDFDIRGYKCFNEDLTHMSDSELKIHYITIGRQMGKKYNINSFIPIDFDYTSYKYLNPELENLDEYQLVYHYINQGKSENKLYKLDGILPIDFKYQMYLKLNGDITINNKIKPERFAIIHYLKYGRNENRKYK